MVVNIYKNTSIVQQDDSSSSSNEREGDDSDQTDDGSQSLNESSTSSHSASDNASNEDEDIDDDDEDENDNSNGGPGTASDTGSKDRTPVMPQKQETSSNISFESDVESDSNEDRQTTRDPKLPESEHTFISYDTTEYTEESIDTKKPATSKSMLPAESDEEDSYSSKQSAKREPEGATTIPTKSPSTPKAAAKIIVVHSSSSSSSHDDTSSDATSRDATNDDESSESSPSASSSSRTSSSTKNKEGKKTPTPSLPQKAPPPSKPPISASKPAVSRNTFTGHSTSSDDSNSSFSVSSGTDPSLAAKLAAANIEPAKPLPPTGSAVPIDGNDISPTPSDTRMERRVSFEDFGQVDDAGSDSYESYETASDEYETDTEEDQRSDPEGVSLDELEEEELEEPEESSGYETDTTYEREVAIAEGRPSPPPSQKPSSDPNIKVASAPLVPLSPQKSKRRPLEVVRETPESPTDKSVKKPIGEKRNRRQPFENIPPTVEANIREIKPIRKDGDTSTRGDENGGANLLKLAGSEGDDRQKIEKEESKSKRGLFGWILGGSRKQKQISQASSKQSSARRQDLQNFETEESYPPYEPPEYDDGISQVTDRVFAPKPPKDAARMNEKSPEPEYPQLTPEELEKEIQEEQQQRFATRNSQSSVGPQDEEPQQRFSIRKFRNSVSPRNTERALADLDPLSIEPVPIESGPRTVEEKEKRNTRTALAGLAPLSIRKFDDQPKLSGLTGRESSGGVKAALMDMPSESVGIGITYDLDAPVQEFSNVHPNPNLSDTMLMYEVLGTIKEDEGKESRDGFPASALTTDSQYEEITDDVDLEEEIIFEEYIGEDDESFLDEEAGVQPYEQQQRHNKDLEQPRAFVAPEKPLYKEESRMTFERRSCIYTIIILLFIVITGVVIWLVLRYVVWVENGTTPNIEAMPTLPPALGPSFGAGTPPALPPVSAPTTAEDVKEELIETLSPYLPDGGESFEDPESPQSQAVDWMSQDSEIYSYEGWKLATRYALAALYYSTAGNDWTNNDLWLSDQDECLWYTSGNVSPCTNNRYTSLVLGDNNLQGTLPEELSLLSNSLASLDLGGILAGEIPWTIGELRLLTSLRLRGNSLSGTIPDSVEQLSSLSFLDLRKNQLGGTIPSELFSALTNMKTMDLGENQFVGQLPRSIGDLRSTLNWLSVGDNQLTGPLPNSLGENTLLSYLNLDNNQFNVFPRAIGQLTNLEILSARNNRFSGPLPVFIGESLTNLEGLYLNNNDFTGSVPDSYGLLIKLQRGLDLSFNKLVGPLPESLGRLTALEHLLLQDNSLSGTIPLSMGSLSELDTLRLDSNNFVGELPTALCDSFDEASSTYYADCRELICPCCNFCCNDATGECTCRFENSQPLLCIP